MVKETITAEPTTAHPLPAKTNPTKTLLTKTVTAKAVTAAALTLSALALAGVAHADGRTMPDVTGKGLVNAYQALNYDTTIQFKDGLGARRLVLWPGSWKVCGQNPAPGTPLEGKKITLTVVKDHEQCGAPAAG
ncbi:PASTA domain-containing protein [Streptomyces inhibens]|uniref:PASTA domain-containing protein n=1 Tax=Streptomyces inhibens TaxID=2293571 RepID=UPI00402AE155